jgi:hypothetical protein
VNRSGPLTLRQHTNYPLPTKEQYQMSTKATPSTYASLLAGLDHGREIADAIQKLPEGRDGDKFAEESLRAQISVRERGLERQYLEDFESAFRVGMRMRLGEHALDSIAQRTNASDNHGERVLAA